MPGEVEVPEEAVERMAASLAANDGHGHWALVENKDAHLRAAAASIRSQERQRVRGALEKVLFRFGEGRSRGVKREYDKTLDREDRHAGHGEAEAYDRASSMLRRALDSLEDDDG